MRAIATLIAFALLVAGCETPALVAPPSDELRAEIKVLGLTAPDERRLDRPEEPVKGTGDATLTGAGQGAAVAFVPAAAACEAGDGYSCVTFIVLGAVVAPVTAVIGAGLGAARSHSAEEVESSQAAFADILAKARPNAALAKRFSELAGEKVGMRIVPLSCEVGEIRCRAERAGLPRYALRLEYLGFAFRSSGQIEPDLRVSATVAGSIFDPDSGKTAYERQWGHESGERPYFDLAKDGGAALEEMIAASHEAVARTVLRDLFEATEPIARGRISDEAVWTNWGPAR